MWGLKPPLVPIPDTRLSNNTCCSWTSGHCCCILAPQRTRTNRSGWEPGLRSYHGNKKCCGNSPEDWEEWLRKSPQARHPPTLGGECWKLKNFGQCRRRRLTCSQCQHSSQLCLRACETCVLWERQCQADSAKDIVRLPKVFTRFVLKLELTSSNLNLTAGDGDGGARGEPGDDRLGDEVDEEAEPEVYCHCSILSSYLYTKAEANG